MSLGPPGIYCAVYVTFWERFTALPGYTACYARVPMPQKPHRLSL